MDEIAIWSRALSDEEIACLWNGGAGREIGAAPLPASLMLLGSGLLGLVGWRKLGKN